MSIKEKAKERLLDGLLKFLRALDKSLDKSLDKRNQPTTLQIVSKVWVIFWFVVVCLVCNMQISMEMTKLKYYKKLLEKNIEECEKQSSDYVLESGKCYINQETKKTEEDCKKQSPDYVFKNGKCYIYLNNQRTK